MLRINSFHFSLGLRVTKKRADEELSESVESLAKGLIAHLEVIVCVSEPSPRIIVTTIVGDEFGVLVFVGILRRAHEKHVLKEMSSALERLWIKGTAHVDVQ